MKERRIITDGVLMDNIRKMHIGEEIGIPVKHAVSISTVISRCRTEMCVEGANWKRIPGIDKEKGLFYIKRIS